MSAVAGSSQENSLPIGSEDDEEYEEELMIMELHGVLDGESVRDAANTGQMVVRKTDTDNPLVQIGSSVYCGKWSQPLGTDLIFRSSNRIVHNPSANEFENSSMLHLSSQFDIDLELVGVSSTRLVGRKALISTHSKASVNQAGGDGPAAPETSQSEETLSSPEKGSAPKKPKPPTKTNKK